MPSDCASPAKTAREDIEAHLRPVRDPLCDFYRLVFRIIRWKRSIRLVAGFRVALKPSTVKLLCNSTIVVFGATVSDP